MRTSFFILFLLGFSLVLQAQKKPVSKSKDSKLKKPDMTVLGEDNIYLKAGATDSNEIIPQEKYSHFAVGGNFGIAFFTGDVPMDAAWPGYGGFAKYSFSHISSIRFQYLHGKISGSNGASDKSSYFTNVLNTYSLQTVFNLGNVDFRKSFPRNNFYFGIGGGILNVNAKHDFPDTTNKNRVYSGNNFFVPISLGVRRKLTNAFDFSLEFNMGISGNNLLDLNETGALPDAHGFVLAGINYNITSKSRPKHIDWSNPVEKIYRDLLKAKQDAEAAMKADGDGDGVPDALDIEKDTKAGYKVDSKGKTLDSDGDDIPDTIDPDPYGFSKALGLYFPTMKPGGNDTSGSTILQFNDSVPKSDFVVISESSYGLPTIVFPPNGFTVHVEQYGLLQQIARIMIIDTSASVLIIGHSDNNKPDMTQLTLAEKRALEVKRKLYRIYEIDETRMLVFSAKDPYIQRYSLSTEGLNRKVEFRIIRPKQKK
jgi:OOP family OmpA-OmpF porin